MVKLWLGGMNASEAFSVFGLDWELGRSCILAIDTSSAFFRLCMLGKVGKHVAFKFLPSFKLYMIVQSQICTTNISHMIQIDQFHVETIDNQLNPDAWAWDFLYHQTSILSHR